MTHAHARRRDRTSDQNRAAGRVVELTPLADDGDHWAATVTSPAFKGLSRVRQHQLVQSAFGARLGTELHALALTTVTP